MKHAPASAVQQVREDATPRPPADMNVRFIDYLRSEPSPAEVAQELVLGHLAKWRARVSTISVVEPDATLRLAGGFGLDKPSLILLGDCSLWDANPHARSIRERRALTWTHRDEILELSPGVRSTPSKSYAIVAVPLMTSASMVGSICVYFDAEGANLESTRQVLQVIADVYVLYLLTNVTGGGARPTARRESDSAESGAGTSERIVDLSPDEFTERQRAILQFLGCGMTYDQIASRIGYSHSTVRMELMHIYRAFGVSSRREAIVEAKRSGLVVEVDNR